MSNRLPEICYFCGIRLDSTNNSKEHVPPKCFFPRDSNYRKELITVPACREHNTGKSSDDEYFQQMVSINILTKEDGISDVVDKAMRGILRNRKLISQLAKKSTLVYVKRPNENLFKPTLAFNIDDIRFKKSIESISKAIYFYEFHQPFFGDIDILDECKVFLHEENSVELNDLLEKRREISATIFQNAEKKGENENIFYYQLLRPAPNERNYFLALKLCFYEGINFIVLFRDKLIHKKIKLNPIILGINQSLI